ncbi:hypothetical protein METBIDRAFT_17791, partial [Metschnikowia bicuspidata var. bicuspidata NRRL YB-4993]
NATETDACDRVRIGTDVFGVSSNGTRLLPISGKKRQEGSVVVWNHWRYLVCKSGLLRRTFGEPPRDYCRYFTCNGSCVRGVQCRFIHDMSRMALCRHYLAGRCLGHCILSHEASEYNTPVCRYHLEDRCSNARCNFSHELPAHARDSDFSIWTCRPFAVGGWCDRGRLCPFAHLYNCPDYEESGLCPRGNSCPLTHTITKRSFEPQNTIVSSYSVDPAVLF